MNVDPPLLLIHTSPLGMESSLSTQLLSVAPYIRDNCILLTSLMAS